MPAKSITNSTNIASLNSTILVDLCNGIFSIDISNSIWIGTGYENIEGVSVKIVNPYGVVIKNYPTSGYDINDPIDDTVEVDIPTQANNYQYGQYVVTVKLTDVPGVSYEVEKLVSFCAPDQNNKTKKYGSLSAILDGNCKSGKLFVSADNVPTYKGVISNSQVNSLVLKYPTVSQVDPLTTSHTSFSAVLFEGEYRFEGTICANYELGDSVSAQVQYKVKKIKNIRCLLDRSCVAARLSQLHAQLDTDCNDAEKYGTQGVIIHVLMLLSVIDANVNDGQDASDLIEELEGVLGCSCTCNCAEGTPIINNSPASDISIEGCNVSSEVVGLTTIYTIDNHNYITEIVDNGGALTISYPTLADCTKTQTITLNIGVVYTQIKAQISNSTEYNYWASVIKNALSGLDATCLGLNSIQVNELTLKQLVQAIITNQCAGGTCNAIISTPDTIAAASDVIASWTNVSGVYEVAAYLDGELKGTVLSPANSFRFIGAADGNNHEWLLVPKCTNGSIGEYLSGSFIEFGCPLIASPSVTSASVTDNCPFDLTSLVDPLPLGITAEWHNLNNTNTSSLVSDPTNAIGGVYFLFGKNSDGCYSVGRQVILECTTLTSCSAPQNLLAEYIVGGFRLRFQSAAYPPPDNSYTVKRRLSSDADVSGSYTTIGTPTWNATASRWEILDTTALNNTLYVYRAISNCSSSAPYIDYTFANITCPTLTLTPGDTDMDYSFTSVSSNITKYEVKIYHGASLIHTDTVLPAYSTPITGTFIYLSEATGYSVRVRAYIGAFYKDCDLVNSATTGGAPVNNMLISNAATDVTVNSSTVSGVPYFAFSEGSFPLATGGTTILGIHSDFTGAIRLSISGTSFTATAKLYVDAILVDCIDLTVGTGNLFDSRPYVTAESVEIVIENGTC